MAQTDTLPAARLQQSRDGDALVLGVPAAPPAPAFLAMLGLLGLMFGAPAIVIALDPGRRDTLSLVAMAFGLLVAAGTAGIAWNALSGRRRTEIRLDAAGIHAGGEAWHWTEVEGIGVRAASRSLPEGDGVQRLAASMVRRQLAGVAEVVLRLRDADLAAPRQVTLASGLDAATANRLRQAILGFGSAQGLRDTARD